MPFPFLPYSCPPFSLLYWNFHFLHMCITKDAKRKPTDIAGEKEKETFTTSQKHKDTLSKWIESCISNCTFICIWISFYITTSQWWANLFLWPTMKGTLIWSYVSIKVAPVITEKACALLIWSVFKKASMRNNGAHVWWVRGKEKGVGQTLLWSQIPSKRQNWRDLSGLYYPCKTEIILTHLPVCLILHFNLEYMRTFVTLCLSLCIIPAENFTEIHFYEVSFQ